MASAAQRFIEKHIGKVWLAGVFAFLYLPLGYLILFSFNSTRQDARFTGFSLQWYKALARKTDLIEGLILSLRVAAMAATLATILGTLAAFALIRYRKFWGRSLFSGMLNAPLVMPEIIIGLSFLLLLKSIQNDNSWSGYGVFFVVLGHAFLGMAYATVVVQTRLQEMNRSLEEAAMDLGCKPFQVFTLVTLPNIAPGIIAAWLLAFTLSFDDVVIAQFLSEAGVNTLPNVVFNYTRRGIDPTIFAAAALLIAVVTVAVIIYSIVLARQARRQSKR